MHRIQIDRSLCSGFGSCAVATSFFVLGPDGIAVAPEVETDDDDVLEAAASCPMSAMAVYGERAAGRLPDVARRGSAEASDSDEEQDDAEDVKEGAFSSERSGRFHQSGPLSARCLCGSSS